ncbi:MAG TPA: Clp protease N-terminal domain-containing protein [Solirubrobacteraceae bacterium]
MFERFTERARQVVVLAQEEARTLKHNLIGTEHILLGLLREEEGLAARVLESLGITVERVRIEVMQVGAAPGEDVASGQIPFTPRAKNVLELALREALSLGHNYIGTEHILLGLVRENEGVAARILLDFDADSEKIRNAVRSMMPSPGTAMRVMHDLDRSWLDFAPAEAFDLAMHLAPLSSEIKFEVRLHTDEEPTFRVSCLLLGNDDVLRELVALEAVGIRAVLDGGHAVRLGHLHWPVEPDTTETSGQ